MVNLLLYGTSFTRQPRISMEGEGIAEASKAGVLRARVDDLVAGLRSPGDNERLVFLARLLRSEGIDHGRSEIRRRVHPPESPARGSGAKDPGRARCRPRSPHRLLDRASLFRDRGLSLDTGIFPDFAIEQTLRDLEAHGVLREGQVARVAVIGPGLDFIDKNEESAYDYYPEQTLQPFALYDSLVRLGLAKANARIHVDLRHQPQVIEHLQRARERAGKSMGYVIQLPRDAALLGRRSSPATGSRWAIRWEPRSRPSLRRGSSKGWRRERCESARTWCWPVSRSISISFSNASNLAAADRFDLIVATNIFVYYDAFEQSSGIGERGRDAEARRSVADQ